MEVKNTKNIDSFEIGLYFDRHKKTPIQLLEELKPIFINKFQIFVYYENQTYNDKYKQLATKLKCRYSQRVKFIAFLYFKLYDLYIPVILHSTADYLTFKIYGLYQYNQKADYKYFIFRNILKSLFQYGYYIKPVRVDIAVDVTADFVDVVDYVTPMLDKINREPYLFKENESVYFNTPNYNKALCEKRLNNSNTVNSQNSRYLCICCYNKTIKNDLNSIITRIEFSYRDKVSRLKAKLKSIADVDMLIDKLFAEVAGYLNYEFI